MRVYSSCAWACSLVSKFSSGRTVAKIFSKIEQAVENGVLPQTRCTVLPNTGVNKLALRPLTDPNTFCQSMSAKYCPSVKIVGRLSRYPFSLQKRKHL
ncbi:uncharacterized protein CYBJADRAFT_98928 [Cyberlindnera jadinii NRRL Y-1542]|uniref:Uncharacterized protein n=1 Tax=Cyberlindnera jadinii (strain ATCC 18201 / CBS 1600 / BCRC 20928 / JCM 3617 / NBRC 0987 / NRRL Y-1542) TaxID=983966 RepID=A0A1E4RZK8_CYBJN|nr:hypothetical protein CYBJADRAFT_98928 [Cyberlindnera jadinii NRRL Y-1542]ODV72686.1 hypothetical protein CYBJADRAFT_98928 [Cyberlindnera jadinii NRRL Y-1542]